MAGRSAHLFEDVFWGPTSDPLAGIKKLHENYQEGVAELEEILNFVNVRMMTEEYYANRLQELASIRIFASRKSAPASGLTGAVPDGTTNSVMQQVLQSLRQEATIASSTHRHMHDTLSRTHTSLKRFLDDHRRLSASRKDTIDAATRRFDALAADAAAKRKDASAKWDAAVRASRERVASAVPAVPGHVAGATAVFGGLDFAVDEFNSLVSDMELRVPKQDIKSIIGTYKSVVSGAAALEYLTTKGAQLKKPLQSPDTANAFMNALIMQGFLKSIAIRNSNKLPVTEQHYQWKKTSLDNEPAHTRTRRDAERAELEYRNAVDAAEDARCVLEAHCVEHMKSVQTALTERLTLAKTVISSYIDSEQSCISPITKSVERLRILLEMFDPEKQVQTMAEQDRTGNARLKPIVYSPSSSKIIVDARILRGIVFGVPLDILSLRDSRKVPDILRKALRALEKGCVDSDKIGDKSQEFKLWLEPNMYTPSVLSLRARVCQPGKTVSLSVLRNSATPDVIGLTKLWLIQLPGSLCGDEIYDALKLLYLSKNDEFANTRAGSIKSLLTTLSPAAQCSLMALVDYWQRLDRDASWSEDAAGHEKFLSDFSQVVGNLVLRPKVETLVTAHDKHPHRFIRDLMSHSVASIFSVTFTTSSSGSTQSLQIDGEDLDPEHDTDLEENDDEVGGSKDISTAKIELIDAIDARTHRLSIVSEFSPSIASKATEDSLSLAPAKSEEDLFLEEEGEGLEVLDADELSKLEAEMDQMLADGL